MPRLVRAAQWIVPGAIYLVMPKCPVCVAAYVTLITGASLSLSAAEQLRTWALSLCAAALAVVLARRTWTAIARLGAWRRSQE